MVIVQEIEKLLTDDEIFLASNQYITNNKLKYETANGMELSDISLVATFSHTFSQHKGREIIRAS